MDREKNLPFLPGDEVEGMGEIREVEELGPGVYYVLFAPDPERAELGREYYAVARDSPIISREAKGYGAPFPGRSDWLAYELDAGERAGVVVRYELYWHRLRNGLLLDAYDDLHSVASFGRETFPAYFGGYPVPMDTPRGYTLRHRRIINGIYWLETTQGARLLAVCYPLADGGLSQGVKWCAELAEHDLRRGIDETLGYYFFREQDACLALFELRQGLRKLQKSRILDPLALMNAIWKNHPLYALQYNLEEGCGRHNALCQLAGSLGGGIARGGDPARMIAFCPGAGCDFLRFPQ